MNAEAPARDGRGLKNSAGERVSESHFIGSVSGCVEADLRDLSELSSWNACRALWRVLDGVSPGDVVKLLVNSSSQVWMLDEVNLRGVKVQVCADSVHTMRKWVTAIAEVVK